MEEGIRDVEKAEDGISDSIVCPCETADKQAESAAEATKRRALLCSTLSLAYLGDAVIELLVRESLLKSGISHPGELVKASKKFVTLEAQSDAVERILPLLDDTETAIFKRGRNAKTHFVPKHGELIQYKRATALETLFGYLHMAGLEERKSELFEVAFPKKASD